MKKLLCVFLASVMLICSLSAFSYASAVTYPYIDETTGTYHRLSYGADLSFSTDYDEFVEHIRSSLLSHSDTIETFNFATADEKYAYEYTSEEQRAAASKVAEKLFYDAFRDAFLNDDNAGGGDYLFNSIDGGFTIAMPIYLSAGDIPSDGEQRYYPFTFRIENIKYFTTISQEQFVSRFADWFNSTYIKEGLTEYEKVKTIYDFVVRNTDYDYDVYEDKYDNTERYSIAHSAFGAICGGLVESGIDVENINFDDYFAYKETVIGQRVPVNYNQGLAVCEGYSKLFYYLCKSNGIDCRIVDGDNIEESEKDSDPHEWNYVYLDDNSAHFDPDRSEGTVSGYQWYQVDTTFAAQKSYKRINLNSYDYFLCGRANINFGKMNHQQPYMDFGEGIREQLYDWYGDALAAYEDYRITKLNFSNIDVYSDDYCPEYVVKRSTVYEEVGGEKFLIIYYNSDTKQKLQVPEDAQTEHDFEYVDVTGFNYNGKNARFTVLLPYLVNRDNSDNISSTVQGEYESPLNYTAKNIGDYTINVIGSDGTTLPIKFNIESLDMSNDSVNDKVIIKADRYGNYNGNSIIPSVSVTDPFGNNLIEDKDFVLSYKRSGTDVPSVKDIGDYEITIKYKNNYAGSHTIDFTMDKIKLSQLNFLMPEFEYIPDYFREQSGIFTPEDYYKHGTANGQTVGDIVINSGVDYSISSSGNIDFGSVGTITLNGIESENVLEGYPLVLNYSVTKKYDISFFNGSYADTNTVNKHYYTGSAIKPTKFDYLDTFLEKGKDYEIVSYSNNVNAGTALVTIKGINGCEGTATMKFIINSAPQTSTSKSTATASYVKPTAKGNTISISASSYTYDGKPKKPTITIYNSSKKKVNSYYYSVSYSNNKNVGTAKATIKFRNGYSGTVTKTFKINPKNTTLSKVTAGKKQFKASWKKYTTQTTGYQIQYSTDKNFKKGNKTVTVSKNKTTSTTVKKLSAKKKYYVRLRTYKTVSKTKYYSSWSKSKTVTTKK